MNKGILKQVENRLAAATKKAAAIVHSRSNLEIMEFWSEFLTEQQRFFNRLGNAAETSSEQGWIERTMNARKQDPIMLYLYQARNADEHGRSSIAKVADPSITLGSSSEAIFIDELRTDHRGRITKLSGWDGAPGNPLRLQFNPGEVEALEVENRAIRFNPPPGLSKVTQLAPFGVRYMQDVYAGAVQMDADLRKIK